MIHRSEFLKWVAGACLGLGILTGCTTTGTTTASNTTPEQAGAGTGNRPPGTDPNAKFRVGVSVPAADHGWTAGMVWWAKEAMAMYPNVEWTFTTADNPTKQIKDLETMMVKGVDAVVILSTESGPITPIAKQIKERGILLVNVDRGFLEPVADIFVEGDNEAFGRKAAEFIVEKLNGQGNILVLQGIPGVTVNTIRVDSANEVFKRHPGIKILESQAGNWSREKSLSVMQAMLLKHKDVDAVWAADDDMALGAEQALKEAGRTGDVFIVGGGGMKDIVKRIGENDPLYPATVTYPPSMIAYGISQAVITLQAGKDKALGFMPRHLKIDCDLVTPGNAKDYYFENSTY